VRLFANKLGLDFDSAKSEAATQELALSAADVAAGAKAVDLRFVLFQVRARIARGRSTRPRAVHASTSSCEALDRSSRARLGTAGGQAVDRPAASAVRSRGSRASSGRAVRAAARAAARRAVRLRCWRLRAASRRRPPLPATWPRAPIAPRACRAAAPQNVTLLTLFVPANQGGGEETSLSRLVLLGAPIQHEGAKRSKEEQAAASKGDWLGSGTAGA
jgi:hypothetical protein